MPRSLWLLVIGMAVNVTGSSFLWPLNTIYMHDHLGKSLSIAGMVLMLNSAATVIGNLFGGVLFDKIGGYRSILFGTITTLFALFCLYIWHGWPHYVIFLTIVGFGSGIIFPAIYAMAGSVWPEGGRKSFNAIYISQNLGVALGSALGGFVASFSFEYIFLANLLMLVLFFLIAVMGYRNISVATGPTSILEQNQGIKQLRKLTSLMILCSAYMLCWVGYVQWLTTIASYTQEINISLSQYSLLWTVNGAFIVLGQPLLAPITRRFRHNLKAQIMIGIVIFIASFAVTAVADGFKGFLAAMIILTAGEMLVWPAVPTIADSLSPKGREGFYQGVVNSTATVGKMFGPVLGGFLVDLYGMSVLFIILIGLLILAIFLASIYDKPLRKEEADSCLASHSS
ncbi:MFS family permease [Oikeobacillus pervagus]|uniref:MFS family permease n=1 Tax=Oikeobacillus pervagus TaxID=1325931 RepID=A0AAJ1WJR6_9BACI|nr:MFS transporter [Oikeobacillus pervagus]MDQ0215763.1 MFS family permease [Oikeobacillus pervagus]